MWRPRDRTYEDELSALVGDCATLLDVGCGDNSPIRAFSGQLFTVGIDGFVPSLQKSSQAAIHDCYVKADIADPSRCFRERSFDCVLASDVIEHFPKEAGEVFLRGLEAIAAKRVVVMTPNGFLQQGEVDSNPYQVHRSGWNADEMRARGYRVIGVRGWKPLRKAFATPRLRPLAAGLAVSMATQPLVRDRPEKAFQLLCVKNFA